MVSSATFLARVISDGRITIPNEVRSFLDIDDNRFVTCTVTIESDVSKTIAESRGEFPFLSSFTRLLEVCGEPGGLEEPKDKPSRRGGRSYLDFLVREGLVARRTKVISGKEVNVYKTTHAGNLMMSRLGGVKYA